MQLARISVVGLFGYANHHIELRAAEPTILTAPNGAGKTHVLLLVDALLRLDVATLARLPFQRLELAFRDGDSVSAERDPQESESLTFRLARDGRQVGKRVQINAGRIAEEVPALPPHIERISDDRFFDRRIGRMVSAELLERRLGHKVRPDTHLLFAENATLRDVFARATPILIDTKRLDTEQTPMESSAAGSVYVARGLAGARIARYINRIRAHITDARRDSIQATQRSDVSFAARALAAASRTVKEGPLHERYDSIVESYERLARNGLAVGERPPEFPEKTTPTVRRILSVFLDDWEQRLQPLLPINEKIETLRRILDSKFEQSGKRTEIDPQGLLRFRARNNRNIRVSSLSSGEQHLVALFTQLLFSAQDGSVVLIDEPEISLHAAWQHAFLGDIASVAELSGLQVIIATHSTAIINGRWDLEEALQLTAPSGGAELDLDDFDVDPEEFLA